MEEKTFLDGIIDWIESNPYRSVIILLVFLLLLFFGLPYAITNWSWGVVFDGSTGPMGDTIGGITGPAIGLIAAALTFLAFYIQYKANLQQRLDIRRERFESKFIEMLRLHKENVSEMEIEGYEVATKIYKTDQPGMVMRKVEGDVIPKVTTGRKVFVVTAAELFAIHKICKTVLTFEDFPNKAEYLIKLAYSLLYNGVNSAAVKTISSIVINDTKYVRKCRQELKIARDRHLTSGGLEGKYQIRGGNHEVKLPFKYKPFSGHSSRFGHYYRHLFMMVKFVAGQDQSFLTYNEKREYLRMVRAQLSKHEQLMLYFNFLSGYGAAWENDTNKFFSQYRMIHNLPMELTRFSIDPRERFKEQIAEIFASQHEFMFEYDENDNRAAEDEQKIDKNTTSHQ